VIEVVATNIQFLPQGGSQSQAEPQKKETEKVVNLEDEDNNLGEAI
jgi:hypothetical protein